MCDEQFFTRIYIYHSDERDSSKGSGFWYPTQCYTNSVLWAVWGVMSISYKDKITLYRTLLILLDLSLGPSQEEKKEKKNEDPNWFLLQHVKFLSIAKCPEILAKRSALLSKFLIPVRIKQDAIMLLHIALSVNVTAIRLA